MTGYYMERLKTRPIRIPSELLEPAFAEVIGGYWEEIEAFEKTEDIEALEKMKQVLLVMGRIADVSHATHCIIALSNQTGRVEALIRELKGEAL